MVSNTAPGGIRGVDVQAVREFLDLTQEELASGVDVSKKTAYNWEARREDELPARAATKFANWAVGQLTDGRDISRVPMGLLARLNAASSFGNAEVENKPASAASSEVPAVEADAFMLWDAMRRSAVRFGDKTARELTAHHVELANRADDAFAFVELALDMGVHPAIAVDLVEGIFNGIVDTGTYTTLSTMRGFDYTKDRFARRMEDLRSRARATEPEDREIFRFLTEHDDPDYSNMSEDDAMNYGLAAHKGDPNIGPEDLPEEP